ncbi:MAG: tetratricopeptide repeat protein, partial [Bacteroidetes bacterium]
MYFIRIALLAFIVFGPIAGFSQTLKAWEKAIDKAWASGDYYAAMTWLSKALERAPDRVDFQYKYAEVCRRFHAYEVAETWYKKVMDGPSSDQYEEAKFGLGLVQKNLGKYEAARDNFRRYAENPNNPSERILLAEKEAENCLWASNLPPPDPTKTAIIHLDRKINSPWSEFGALPRQDSLFYSSYRYDKAEDKNRPPRKISKIMLARPGARGRPLPRRFNDPKKFTAYTAFSTSGDRMYFAICDYVGPDIQCALYYREKDRRGRWKKTPVALPASVNLPGFTTTHPAIGFDSTRQKEVLFFASNRPGGAGGMDIWQTEIDENT